MKRTMVTNYLNYKDIESICPPLAQIPKEWRWKLKINQLQLTSHFSYNPEPQQQQYMPQQLSQ